MSDHDTTPSHFPEMDRIEPMLAAIENFPEFNIIRREGYTTIDYVYMRPETFGSIALDPPPTHNGARLRREARGVKFDALGALIARPFHKFFNLGEKPETLLEALPWSEPHVVLDKMDGSMVHPFAFDDVIRWATRNGETPQAALALAHMGSTGLGYEALARDLMADGLTPLFEFVSPKNRIVIAYPEPQALLLGVRRNRTGAYLPDTEMRVIARAYAIPAVRAWGSDVGSQKDFVQHARGLEDVEGFVIRFANDAMVKLKADAYVLRHGALSNIASEKFALRVVLEGAEDDISPLLPSEIARDLARYAQKVRQALTSRVNEIAAFVAAARNRIGDDRRAFAAEVNGRLPAELRAAAFKAWEGADAMPVLRDQVLRATATFDRINQVRHLLDGAHWTLAIELES